MKPNTPLSIRPTSRLKTVAVVVVTAISALGLPAQAWPLEPEPSASPTAPAPATASPKPAARSVWNDRIHAATQPVPMATTTQAVTDTASGAIDMKALNAAIGANGAYMGQGLKTRLAGSPGPAVLQPLRSPCRSKAPGRPPAFKAWT